VSEANVFDLVKIPASYKSEHLDGGCTV